MSTTIGCPIPGASQPKEQRRYIDRPMRLIDAREVMIAVFNAIEIDEDEYNAIKAEVDEIPTIDPESLRPTAKWENGDDYYGDDIIWFCSACKNGVVLRGGTPEEYSYRYCPNCGARMVNTDEKHCT
jgi:hypothetical protein